MAKQSEKGGPSGQPTAVAVIPEENVVVIHDTDDIFNRAIIKSTPVKSITIRRTLTKPIVAIAHKENMVAGFESEPYQIVLPVAGRSDKPQPADVADVVDMETGEQVTLVLNAVMKSALERAGGTLRGRIFAFTAGEIKADKKYRLVDVQEVEIER